MRDFFRTIAGGERKLGITHGGIGQGRERPCGGKQAAARGIGITRHFAHELRLQFSFARSDEDIRHLIRNIFARGRIGIAKRNQQLIDRFLVFF